MSHWPAVRLPRPCAGPAARLTIAGAMLLMLAMALVLQAPEAANLPPVVIQDAGGERHALRDLLADGATLVLFWNTPCSSCLDKLREVVAFAKARPEPDFRFLMINTDPPRNAKQVKPFLHRYGFDPACNYMDSNAEAFRLVQGGKQPLLLLLGPAGEMLFRSDACAKSDLDSLDAILADRARGARGAARMR